MPRKSGGAIVDWIGTALDIDDLHRAQTELRHKEEHLRLALEGARLTTWQREVAVLRESTSYLLWRVGIT